MKKLIFTSFVAALSMACFAASATGKWNGKITMDLSGIKKMIQQKTGKVTPEQKKQVDMQMTMIDANEKAFAKAIVTMELKKDGTVSISQSMNGKTEEDKGKWIQAGNKVKMFGFSAVNGGPKEMNGVLGSTGKTLFFDLSDEMKKQAIKKGAPATFSGKMAINFTKA